MRVFIIVAMVVKIKRPSRCVDVHVPLRGTQQLRTLICPPIGPAELFEINAQKVFDAYIGPEAPAWSPEEDENDDLIDLHHDPVLYCTSCQDYVVLPFGVLWQCPKCNLKLT